MTNQAEFNVELRSSIYTIVSAFTSIGNNSHAGYCSFLDANNVGLTKLNN